MVGGRRRGRTNAVLYLEFGAYNIAQINYNNTVRRLIRVYYSKILEKFYQVLYHQFNLIDSEK